MFVCVCVCLSVCVSVCVCAQQHLMGFQSQHSAVSENFVLILSSVVVVFLPLSVS